MPRLIDHERRREELAEALWRVLSERGVSAVSLRTVAAQAGVSTGSLRHVFPSKEDLLVFSMELVHRRVTGRLNRRAAEPTPDAVAWLSELLPLDDERRLEMEVNLALLGEGGAHQALRTMRASTTEGIHAACRAVLEHLRESGAVSAQQDLGRESARLAVLVDGLAVQLLSRTALLTPADARDLLRDHLAAIR